MGAWSYCESIQRRRGAMVIHVGDIDLVQIITWAIIGLIAGFLATLLVHGRRLGTLTSIIVGLVGAVVGGILFSIVKIQLPPFLESEFKIRLIDIVVAFIGAVIVLLIVGFIYRRRGAPAR